MALGDLLVVEHAVTKAAVEDADEAVGESASGPVVGVAGGPPLVVERPGAGLVVRAAKAHN